MHFAGTPNLKDIYYGGTEEQWNNITISDHAFPDGVTVHYNSPRPDTNSTVYDAAGAPEMSPEEPDAEPAVLLCSYSASGLEPRTTYMFYSVKSLTADDLFGSANLLYVRNVTSDANGDLAFTYTPTENFPGASAFLAYKRLRSLSDAKITINDCVYDGTEAENYPTVIYGEKALTRDVDYSVSCVVRASEPGTYMLTVEGIGEYTGLVFIDYKIVDTACRHANAVDLPVAATVSEGGYTLRYCPDCGELQRTNETLAMPDVDVKMQDGAAVLTWSAVAGATGYEIYEGETKLADVAGAMNTFTVSAVTDTLRTLKVRAISDTLGSSESENIDLIAPGVYLTYDGKTVTGDSITEILKSFKKEKLTGDVKIIVAKDIEEKSISLPKTAASYDIRTANGAVITFSGNVVKV